MPLKTKQVGAYTVTQMSALESARLRLFQRRNLEWEQKQDNPDPAEVEARQEWAVVAACTTPYIAYEDYISIPLTETSPLAEAVEELNSDLVAGNAPDKSKKKLPSKPTKSIDG